MPQKKNADPIELVRAKTGIIIGELVNFLTVIKGLPIGYNRDLQETKPPAIKDAAVLSLSLPGMTLAIKQMELNKDVMQAAAENPELIAVDIVEYLVCKGVPFRQAHEAVAQLVQYARENVCPLPKFDLASYKKFSTLFADDVYDLFDAKKSLAEKNSFGSTGISSVKQALVQAKKRLKIIGE